MNKVIKKAAMVAAVSCALTSTAFAGASANVGVMSDYVWRGVSQNNSKPSIMAGADYEASNGLYVGTWAAQVDDGGDDVEIDLYGGFSKELSNGFGYDVGAISYNYPGAVDWDFTELYINGSYKFVELGISKVTNADFAPLKDTTYTHITLSKDLGPIAASATAGSVNTDIPGADYKNYQIAGTYESSIGDLTAAFDTTDISGGDDIISLTWSKSFDF